MSTNTKEVDVKLTQESQWMMKGSLHELILWARNSHSGLYPEGLSYISQNSQSKFSCIRFTCSTVNKIHLDLCLRGNWNSTLDIVHEYDNNKIVSSAWVNHNVNNREPNLFGLTINLFGFTLAELESGFKKIDIVLPKDFFVVVKVLHSLYKPVPIPQQNASAGVTINEDQTDPKNKFKPK